MRALETKTGALTGGQTTVPRDICCRHCIARRRQVRIPRAGNTGTLIELQRYLPAADSGTAVIGYRDVQHITAAPTVRAGRTA